MNAKTVASLLLSSTFFVVACASDPTTTTPPAPSPDEPGDTPPKVQRTALAFVAPCTATACGTVPESSTSEKPTCVEELGACGWTDPNPEDTVSYRFCEATECEGPAPDANVCPAGTKFGGADCGAENDEACRWRSSCAPPRLTTPCPDPEACGGQPMIGVICEDGTNGGLVCVTDGNTCRWERSCD